VETLLIHLLIGLIVFGALFALVKLVLPHLELPAWTITAVLIVLSTLFLVWLIYLLLPLVHMAV
jgi:hypothetical protein